MSVGSRKNSLETFRVKLASFLLPGLCGLFTGGLLLGAALASEAQLFQLWWMRMLMVVPLLLILMGVYSCISAFRKQITIHDEEVIVQEVFKTKRFRLSNVTAIEWGAQANHFLVRFCGGKVDVSIPCYSKQDFNRMVSIFRVGVPKERQQAWGAFCLASTQRLMIEPEHVGKDMNDAIQRLADQGSFDSVQTLEPLAGKRGDRSSLSRE